MVINALHGAAFSSKSDEDIFNGVLRFTSILKCFHLKYLI
jgi:hypothetical protein